MEKGVRNNFRGGDGFLGTPRNRCDPPLCAFRGENTILLGVSPLALTPNWVAAGGGMERELNSRLGLPEKASVDSMKEICYTYTQLSAKAGINWYNLE